LARSILLVDAEKESVGPFAHKSYEGIE